MSSVPLRPRSPFFTFDSETGSRRPRWVAVLAGLLAVALAFAGVLIGVTAASAHIPKASADCYQVHVDMKAYNTHGDNSIRVVIDGAEVYYDDDFGHEIIQSFPIPDPTKATSWSVEVNAWDDTDGNPNQGYSRVFSGTTTGCAAPAIDLQATVCNTIAGTTKLTATFSSLLGGVTYSAQLFKNGAPYGAAFAPSTAAPTVWDDMEAGVTYKLTVTSTNPTGLNKSVETFVVACPQNSTLQVTVIECTSPTQPNAQVSVEATSLVPNRSYTLQVFIGATPYGSALPIAPGSGTSVTTTIAVPPSTSGMTVVLTDTAASPAVTKTSTTFSTSPCPTQPDAPTVGSQECTVVGGAQELTVTLTNLTPGRSYLVQINGSTVGAPIVANGSNQGGLVFPVTPGDYVVTVVDELVPTITASSPSVTVAPCPTQPVIEIDATECSVPGGAGTITITSLTGLSAGRTYTVTLTQGAGQAVPGHPAQQITTADLPLDPFTGLEPGIAYTVTVKDDAAGLMDAASHTLVACPNTPDVTLTLECLLLDGDSLVTATIGDLESGAQYTVEVTGPTGPVASTTVTGGPAPSTAGFQLPNNVTYAFTVTKVGNPAIVGTAEIFAAICDLPTFPLPELPTLALTGGGDTTMPMLGALGLVQFGVALLALAAMLQYRPRTRES